MYKFLLESKQLWYDEQALKNNKKHNKPLWYTTDLVVSTLPISHVLTKDAMLGVHDNSTCYLFWPAGTTHVHMQTKHIHKHAPLVVQYAAVY